MTATFAERQQTSSVFSTRKLCCKKARASREKSTPPPASSPVLYPPHGCSVSGLKAKACDTYEYAPPPPSSPPHPWQMFYFIASSIPSPVVCGPSVAEKNRAIAHRESLALEEEKKKLLQTHTTTRNANVQPERHLCTCCKRVPPPHASPFTPIFVRRRSIDVFGTQRHDRRRQRRLRGDVNLQRPVSFRGGRHHAVVDVVHREHSRG